MRYLNKVKSKRQIKRDNYIIIGMIITLLLSMGFGYFGLKKAMECEPDYVPIIWKPAKNGK